MNKTLFEDIVKAPLADRLRPTNLNMIIGQEHILSSQGPIGQMITNKHMGSIILWGPPGSG